MKKSLLSFIIMVISLCFMGTQCHKDYILPNPAYEFAEKLTLTPYKKVYSVNDTVWLQFQTTDKKLYDKLSNTKISTDTSFLRLNLYYHKLYVIGTTEEYFAEVKVDNAIDMKFTTLYPWYNNLQFKTDDCNKSFYFFRIGFILKKTGIFSIEPYAEISSCPSKSTGQYSKFKFSFDLTDCNKDIYSSIPQQSRMGWGEIETAIDRKEFFVFKVE